MATATSLKKNWNKKNIKKEYGKIHDRLLNISEETVETTVVNIEKWQKLFAKSFTASTPLVEKGIDITFEVAETVAEQYKSGGQRLKSLLGLGSKTFINTKKVKSTKSTAAKAVKTGKATAIKTTKAKATKVQSKAASLTDINGIGPKIAGLLNVAGINNLQDLAQASLKTLEGVLDKAGPRFQMHDPTSWVKQAQKLIVKK